MLQILDEVAPIVTEAADFAKHNDASLTIVDDLLVMGALARSGVAGMLMGNSAEQIPNGIECSVLAIKPSTFSCPVHLDGNK